jgi:hypothetical protein
VAADDGRQGFALLLEGRSSASHTSKTNTFRKSGKGESYEIRKVAEKHVFTETVGMRKWNRDLFVKLVKAKVASGVPFEAIAQGLEMAPATLQGFMDQRDRPPSKRMLDLAPDFFQVDLDDLWAEDLKPEAIELRHARSMLRDSLGYEVAETYSDAATLQWYRFGLTMLNTARNNTPSQG